MVALMANQGAMSDKGFKRLMEIETKYRTHRSADQLHAIALFPKLFDDFPVPVIINAAILKLADYYRNSNNIQRHAILQVVKKSEPHLKKLLNVEETIKRISPTLHSNDPLARALTLRVFGCMATIVYDRTDVYHIVIHSLDSSEAMEVSAAVYAADKICAQSQKFCAIISGKLAFMVRDSKTPLPLRRRLIRIFGHMFEDITLARLARKTCLDILNLNQDGEYTVAILRTLTRLASHSLVDVQQQIELLLQNARSHPLSDNQRVSLTCLGSLAQKGIEFHPHQIKAIFKLGVESKNEKTVLRCMVTLGRIFRLTSGVLSSLLLLDSGKDTVTEFIQMAIQILEDSRSRLVHLECYSLLSVIIPGYREFMSASEDATYLETVKTVTKSMELFLVWIWSSMTASLSFSTQSLGKFRDEEAAQGRIVLEMLLTITLQQASPLEAQEAIDSLFKTLLDWIETYQDWSVLLSKALLHLARQAPQRMHALYDRVISILERKVDIQESESFTLLFRALLESAAMTRTLLVSDDIGLESKLSPLFERFSRLAEPSGSIQTRDRWELYQLARFSLQSGWPALALLTLKCSSVSGDNIQDTVQSVPNGLWLSSVQMVASIEGSVQHAGRMLVTALQHNPSEKQSLDLYEQQQGYAKVIGYLEEMCAYKIDRDFQLRLCTLRRNYLRTCQLAVTTLHQLSMSLSRYHHSSIFDLPGDESCLLECADQFNELAHQYTLLSAPASSSTSSLTSPSRDLSSDRAMEVLYTLCLVLAYSLQKLANILSEIRSSDNVKQIETFDIDPLLIPLLFDQQQDDMDHDRTITRRNTFINVFRKSTRMILEHLTDNLRGRDLQSLERGISIVRQLIAQFVAYPVPIPQEFFVSNTASFASKNKARV
ncbi:hypothetical protein MVEG_00301 [Podila verticillata NRRL 6337]|nr:hypothetical protein MVEG_00301 [Podila verticillata NRRL 6337]